MNLYNRESTLKPIGDYQKHRAHEGFHRDHWEFLEIEKYCHNLNIISARFENPESKS